MDDFDVFEFLVGVDVVFVLVGVVRHFVVHTVRQRSAEKHLPTAEDECVPGDVHLVQGKCDVCVGLLESFLDVLEDQLSRDVMRESCAKLTQSDSPSCFLSTCRIGTTHSQE